MKQFTFLAAIVILAACSSNEQQQKENTSEALGAASEISTNVPDTLCFIRTSGDKNEDTNALQLVIRNNNVSGSLYYLPHEKDARIGTIAGEKKGDVINAVWSYMQEGMNDTLSVSFKMKGNGIFQKPNVFSPKRGKEVLGDNVDYELEYVRMECNEFPVR